MKALPTALSTFLLVLFGALASGSAMAQHHGHGGGHWGHGGGVGLGFSFGVPLYGPAYYPYAPYPAYAYPAPAPAYGYPAPAYGYDPSGSSGYVEQGNATPPPSPGYGDPGTAMTPPPQAYGDPGNPMTAPPPPQAPVQSPGNWWFYCPNSKAYYPYVRECASGWQRVPPQPPNG